MQNTSCQYNILLINIYLKYYDKNVNTVVGEQFLARSKSVVFPGHAKIWRSQRTRLFQYESGKIADLRANL